MTEACTKIISEHTTQHKPVVPFLKWAGGKRWFVSRYSNLLPTTFDTYIEPFLGAASVYFYLEPAQAILSDLNTDLIDTYIGVRDNWKSLQNSLRYRQKRHDNSPSYYYFVRKKMPIDLTQRASRLIYLNRTCFNGIYRVNKDKQFNVPRGTKNSVILETDDFYTISKLLKNAELVSSDFEPVINRANPNDFVFVDPPYTVLHNNNGFRKYNDVLFSWNDQQRLATTLLCAAKRGVKIICTNANHDSIRSLYDFPEFSLQIISRYSRISANRKGRKDVEELVIRANI